MHTGNGKAFTVIGHRGARGHAPENTLLAIDTGIALGAAMVEFDVQRHGDQLVVIHDLRLERTTNGYGRVADMPFDALRRLDAGEGQTIPILAEVLDLVAGRAKVNIELKTGEGTSALVSACIRDYLGDGWQPEQFLVSSFHLPELYEFTQMLPEVPVGVLLCGVPLDWAACATELQADCVSLSAEFVDQRLVEDVHSQGRRVYVYTVNEEDEIRRLIAQGIDGVFSDYPDRALAVAAAGGL